VIYLAVSYCMGTLVGMYIGYTGFRSYWMTKGASKCYDMLNEKGLLSKKRYEPNRH
jgi:hypothetical protein